MLIISHPCRAILPAVLGESSELETRLQAFCIKIIFEVVCIDVTSKKEGIKRKCASDYMQQKQVPSLWTSYHIAFQETPFCWLRQSCLRDRTRAAPEIQEQGPGLSTTLGMSKFPPFSFFSHSAQEPSSWEFGWVCVAISRKGFPNSQEIGQ